MISSADDESAASARILFHKFIHVMLDVAAPMPNARSNFIRLFALAKHYTNWNMIHDTINTLHAHTIFRPSTTQFIHITLSHHWQTRKLCHFSMEMLIAYEFCTHRHTTQHTLHSLHTPERVRDMRCDEIVTKYLLLEKWKMIYSSDKTALN